MKNKLFETVWTCDFCGKEFDTKKESDKHELNCKKNGIKKQKNTDAFSDDSRLFRIIAYILIFILSMMISPKLIWIWCIWLLYKSALENNKKVSPSFPKPINTQSSPQTYSGYNATLEIKENGVVIKKKSGLLSGSAFLGGEKTIPYSSITAIEYKKPDMYPGWIRFSLVGVQQKSGPFSAAYDENAILFHFDPGGTFKQAKEIIEDKINKFHSRN